MLKNLILVGGTMGVGKTAACRELQQLLPRNVFLDGDWCWDARPFTVTEETQAMVLDNIGFLLRQFLTCSVYENVIFCWVMHRQKIWDEVETRLNGLPCRIHRVALTCSPEALRSRLERDVAAGRRREDVIGRSLTRLPLYADLKAPCLDTSRLTAAETARAVARQVLQNANP